MAGPRNQAGAPRGGLLGRLDVLSDRLNRLYRFANRQLRGYPALLYRVILAFGDHEGAFMAAALAYYALLSLFPLLLLLIAVGSMFLTVQEAKDMALSTVGTYLPTALEVASRTVEEVLRERGAIGAVALLGLIWTASGVFGAIFRAVNRAWGESQPGPAWKSRLAALILVLIVGMLFIVNLIVSTTHSILQSWRLSIWGWDVFQDPAVSRLAGWLSALVSLAVNIATFVVIYRFLPRAPVAWRDVWPAGVVAGIVYQLAKLIFTWWLGTARYNLVYGSLGAIVGVLLWSYVSSLILLMGAELTAQYGAWRRAGRPVDDRLPRELREEYL